MKQITQKELNTWKMKVLNLTTEMTGEDAIKKKDMAWKDLDITITVHYRQTGVASTHMMLPTSILNSCSEGEMDNAFVALKS